MTSTLTQSQPAWTTRIHAALSSIVPATGSRRRRCRSRAAGVGAWNHCSTV